MCINNTDQLSKIIQKLGPFKDEDLNFISDKNAKDYTKKM